MRSQFGSLTAPRALDTVSEAEKRLYFTRETGIRPVAMAFVEQVHGTEIADVYTATHALGVHSRADAMVTDISDIVLVIRTADCVPVIIMDEQRGVVAIAHAGWKGVVSGVIGLLMEHMHKHYGCVSDDVRVVMGPAICSEHYDVTTVVDDRVARFEKQFSVNDSVIVRKNQSVALDLPQACFIQCKRFGIPAESIQLPTSCTFDDAHWPSHRREGQQRQNHVWTWVCLSKA